MKIVLLALKQWRCHRCRVTSPGVKDVSSSIPTYKMLEQTYMIQLKTKSLSILNKGVVITLIFQKDTILYISIFCTLVCDFQCPLSYEHILTIFLYTDIDVVVFILLNFLGWQNMWGGQLPPPPFLRPCSRNQGCSRYVILSFLRRLYNI